MVARVAADRRLTRPGAMLTSSSRVRRSRSHTPTWTARPGSVTLPVVTPSQVSRSIATTGPGAGGGGSGVRVEAGQADGYLGLQPAAVLAAGGHEGQHGQQAGAPGRVGGARRAGPEVGPPLLVARRHPGQPARDVAAACLPRGQEHRVLPDVVLSKASCPSLGSRVPASQGTHPAIVVCRTTPRSVPVRSASAWRIPAGGSKSRSAARGSVQQRGGLAEVVAQQVAGRHAVQGGQAGEPGGQRLARAGRRVQRPPPAPPGVTRARARTGGAARSARRSPP